MAENDITGDDAVLRLARGIAEIHAPASVDFDSPIYALHRHGSSYSETAVSNRSCAKSRSENSAEQVSRPRLAITHFS
jgi:hypothetical protein